MVVCQYCDEEFADQKKVAEHEKICPENPFTQNYVPNIITLLKKILARATVPSDKVELDSIIRKMNFYYLAPHYKRIGVPLKTLRKDILGIEYEMQIPSTVQVQQEQNSFTISEETYVGKIIIVTVPPAFVGFGGFSIAGEVKRYFPDDETKDFDIIIPDGLVYKAHKSQVSRVKIIDGNECFRRLGVKEYDTLKIEILELLKSYRIIEVIHKS